MTPFKREPLLTEYETQDEPRIDYAQRRHERAAMRSTSRSRRAPWIVAAVVAVLVVAIVAAEMASSYGRVHSGVTVSGVDVGGLTASNAALELEKQLPGKTTAPVVVVHGDKQWSVTAEEIGLDFDYQSLADDAMAVGRSGGLITSATDRIDAWLGGTNLAATAQSDTEKMDAVIDAIAEGSNVAPVDATVEFRDGVPEVIPSENGVALRRDAMKASILAAMLSDERRVQVPVETAAVQVTEAEAAAAAEVAKTMVAGPVEVAYESKTWTFDADDIAKWIVFRRSDDTATPEAVATSTASQNVTLIPMISAKKAAKTVVPAVGAKVGRKAKNARFKTANGQVTIVPSEDGVGPDMDALASSLTTTLADANSERRAEMKTALTRPAITTEDAESMGIRERLSRFTTTFASGNRSRVNNIHTLGDSLDGTLIAPGKTFSFNGTVGQRTAEKGYQEANAIVNGKLVPQLGGGICQVGTTIFNAVFESGLPVVQRRNHSFYISHYPKGRDATVSWGGPDFKFKNDTDEWVLVSVSYTNSSITVALYGTDPGYDVEAEVGEWRNVRDFPVEEVKDKTMAKGVRVVEDPGVDGKSITVKRIVSKDGEKIRTDSFVSVYKPKTEVVRVGTKKIEAEVPEPAPTEKP